MSASDLSDEELRQALKQYGYAAGPILPTTRKLYENKLERLIGENTRNGVDGHHEDDDAEEPREYDEPSLPAAMSSAPSKHTSLLPDSYEKGGVFTEVRSSPRMDNSEMRFRPTFAQNDTNSGADRTPFGSNSSYYRPIVSPRVAAPTKVYRQQQMETKPVKTYLPWWARVVLFVLLLLFITMLLRRIADAGDAGAEKRE